MLPQDVLEAVDRMEMMTSGNKKWVMIWIRVLMSSGVLNVCSPYTARDETTTAIRNSVQEVYDGSLPLRYVLAPCSHPSSHPSHQRIGRYLQTET
jgi:undecaprenyl pyrophosphate synthase